MNDEAELLSQREFEALEAACRAAERGRSLPDQAAPAAAQAPPGTVAAPARRILPASFAAPPPPAPRIVLASFAAAPARPLPALLYRGPTRNCAAAAEVEAQAQALLDAAVPLVGFDIE
jgi:hypothetical protein